MFPCGHPMSTENTHFKRSVRSGKVMYQKMVPTCKECASKSYFYKRGNATVTLTEGKIQMLYEQMEIAPAYLKEDYKRQIDLLVNPKQV